jgi:integrase
MKPSEYLKDFEERMRCAFSSEDTIRNYLSAVNSFFKFVSGRTETDPALLLRKYITISLQGYEAKTVNLHRSAIVKFFKLCKNIEIDTISVPRRKEPKKLPKIISIENIQLAISKTINIKHKLILSLFFGCGIRLGEMKRLRRKNIIKSMLWLEDAKGQKHRIVPIPRSILEILESYISGMEPNIFVFGDLCKRTFEKIVSNAFARIGIKASPHMLRHSFGTYQIASGQNPFKVQSWLGHSSIKTTQIYVHLSQAMLSESTDLLQIKENYTN